MIGAIIKATFRVCDQGGHNAGKDVVIKTYRAETKEQLDMNILHDVRKYGYINVEPLTTEQYEQLKDNK